MNTDTTEDQRLGPEVLKQTAELYRRLRNTLRWLLGALDGFTPSEIVPNAALPELERWVLHRLWELDGVLRRAVATHDWAGVFPAIHTFCAADLSAFYFDVRKDSLYCDRPDHPTRRAARTVLDHLHRCLTTWLAPVLVFTAEEAWVARFGEGASVHLQDFPDLPAGWQDENLAVKWRAIRSLRDRVNTGLEQARQDKLLKSSLEASVAVDQTAADLLGLDELAQVLIVSEVTTGPAEGELVSVRRAPGLKCERCWRVLPEVGRQERHPTLCVRCTDAVESGLVARVA